MKNRLGQMSAAALPGEATPRQAGRVSRPFAMLGFTARQRSGAVTARSRRDNRRCRFAGRPKAGSLLLALALTGCAHTPLITSCITPSQYQQLESQRPPKVHDKLTGQADKDVRPLAGSIIEHRAYEDVLLGTLKVCSTNTK